MTRLQSAFRRSITGLAALAVAATGLAVTSPTAHAETVSADTFLSSLTAAQNAYQKAATGKTHVLDRASGKFRTRLIYNPSNGSYSQNVAGATICTSRNVCWDKIGKNQWQRVGKGRIAIVPAQFEAAEADPKSTNVTYDITGTTFTVTETTPAKTRVVTTYTFAGNKYTLTRQETKPDSAAATVYTAARSYRDTPIPVIAPPASHIVPGTWTAGNMELWDF